MVHALVSHGRHLFFLVGGLLLLPFGVLAQVSDSKNSPHEDYLARIKPLLKTRCFSCHGALKQEAELRLDTVAGMLKGSYSGPVVVKGQPAKSMLLQRVSAKDVADRMPPEHEGEAFTAAQIALVRDWIAAGAPGPKDERPEPDPRDHWAFRPIVRPEVPKVRNAGWVRNPIDAFLAKRHEDQGLVPQEEASRPLLLRRLTLDLIGLPPTPEEIAAVQADQSPDWYDRAVRRLLDDPRHGERWARHWMDIWRYSDWWGLGNQLRNSQQHIWHWRDWIVESVNGDLPYDQMVRLMLAGDEIAPQDLQQLRATGFLARNWFLFNRHQWMDETVEHVSKAFLGLTANCAKCHDHKYDPISQTDYYRLRAFFEPYHVRTDVVPGEPDPARDGIPRAFDGVLDAPTYRFVRGDENNPDKSVVIRPGIPDLLRFAPLEIEPVDLPLDAWQPERRPWVADTHRKAALAKVQAAEAASKTAASQPEAPARKNAADLALADARAELRSIEQRAAALRAGNDDKDRTLARAAALAEREAVAARARATLADAEARRQQADPKKRPAVEKEVAAARQALDKALLQLKNPGDKFTPFIGARWSATRFLSSTRDDPAVAFPARSTGRRKALADWITDPRNPLTARVAVNHLWTRHFGTPLVPTVFDFGRNGQPPTHPELLDWLAAELVAARWSMKHLHRLIVESAAYRMSSSSHGAKENLARDPDNLHLWRRSPSRLESQAVRDALLALSGTLDGTRGGPPVLPAQQADSKRRSLYFFHSNNDRNLFLTMFDEALVTGCYRRDASIVPQQALALTNSRLVLDASRPIAARLAKHAGVKEGNKTGDEAFIRTAFLVLLADEPTPQELAACARSLAAWRELPEAGQGGAAADFARANLVWVLLNHNDFVTIR